MTIILKSKDFSRKGLKGDIYRLLGDSLDEIGYSKALSVLTNIATKSWKYSHGERVERLDKILNSKNLKLSNSERKYAEKMIERCYIHVHKTSGTKKQIQNIEGVLNGYANLCSQLNGIKTLYGKFNGNDESKAMAVNGGIVPIVYNLGEKDSTSGAGNSKSSGLPLNSDEKVTETYTTDNKIKVGGENPKMGNLRLTTKKLEAAQEETDGGTAIKNAEDAAGKPYQSPVELVKDGSKTFNKTEPGYVEEKSEQGGQVEPLRELYIDENEPAEETPAASETTQTVSETNVREIFTSPAKPSFWQKTKQCLKDNLAGIGVVAIMAAIIGVIGYSYSTLGINESKKDRTAISRNASYGKNIEDKVNEESIKGNIADEKIYSQKECDELIAKANKSNMESIGLKEEAGGLANQVLELEKKNDDLATILEAIEVSGISEKEVLKGDEDVYNVMSMVKIPERRCTIDKKGSLTEVMDIEYISRNSSNVIATMEDAAELAEKISRVYSPSNINSEAFDKYVLKACNGDKELADKIVEKFEEGKLQPTIWDNLAQFSMILEDGRVVYTDVNGDIVVVGTRDSINQLKGELK